MVKPHERNTRYVDAVMTIPKVRLHLTLDNRDMSMQTAAEEAVFRCASHEILVGEPPADCPSVQRMIGSAACAGNPLSYVRDEPGLRQGADWAGHVLRPDGRRAAAGALRRHVGRLVLQGMLLLFVIIYH